MPDRSPIDQVSTHFVTPSINNLTQFVHGLAPWRSRHLSDLACLRCRFRPAVCLASEDQRWPLRYVQHRPPSLDDDLGTTPPRARSAPSGSAQKRDNGTHRPVKSRLRRDVTDRGLLMAARPEAGQVQSLRGSGWPPTNGIAWIQVGKRRSFPRMRGEGAGVGYCPANATASACTSRRGRAAGNHRCIALGSA